MIIACLKLILAILLVWPRGYVLVYVIDRAKNFSFGFKFFVGLLFGFSAFTLDVFAASVLGGFLLAPWIFYLSAGVQIFSLEAVIYFFERKFLLPDFKKFVPFWQKQYQNFKLWPAGEKIILSLTIFSQSLWLAGNFWLGDKNWIFNPLAVDKTAPLNDYFFKLWLMVFSGEEILPYLNLINLAYYFLFLLIFYFLLPSKTPHWAKLSGLYVLSALPLIYFPQTEGKALIFGIFLLFIIVCLFNFLAKFGNSFFYISGIAGAFAIWTDNAGFLFVLPALILITLAFFMLKICNGKQMFIYWFFTFLTFLPWLTYIFKTGYFPATDFSFIKLLINLQLAPLLILILIFFLPRFFGKIKLREN